MDKADLPTFRYFVYGARVEDAVTPLEGGEGIRRTVTIQGAPANMYLRLAEGNAIETLKNDLFIVDGRSYYLRLDDAGGAKAVVRDSNGKKELLIPVQNKLTYSILF